MPNEQRPLKVFLCYAHSDQRAVHGLYDRLVKDGVNVWLDEDKLIGGQDWELEIRNAVCESNVVIVCLSKQFNQAGFRQKEVKWALDTAMGQPEGEIFLIPARLEPCENLKSLEKWHWVDLFEADGYDVLIQSLQLRAKKIGASLERKEQGTVETVYRLNIWLAYGVAILLGLLASVVLNTFAWLNTLGLLAVVFFLPGVWASAANRRWTFGVSFSTVAISLAWNGSRVDLSLFSVIIILLTFGLLVDVLLFQVGATQKIYAKALWSLAAAALFTIPIVVFDFGDAHASVLSKHLVIYSAFFAGFIFASCLGVGIARVLRNIWPELFKVKKP